MKKRLSVKALFLALFFIFLISLLSFNLYYLDKVYFLCPVTYTNDILIRVDRRGNGYFNTMRSGRRRHRGVDLLAKIGSPVFAARSGIVIETRDEKKGMGKFVRIKHPGGIITLYGHLSEINVVNHKMVRQGQIIGRVGKTGNARHPAIRPHLHFEIKKDNIPEDPLDYL